MMSSKEAKLLGIEVVDCLTEGKQDEAEVLLNPVLYQRVSFSTLDKVGWTIGQAPADSVVLLADKLAGGGRIGSWVTISSALSCQLPAGMERALAQTMKCIIQADIWYATDIFGERVVGPALLVDFHPALGILTDWRDDANRWVRRSVGVAVHLWSKRTRGSPEMSWQARQLLIFLEPVLEERERDTIKGIEWGLKTLGKYYPVMAGDWLEEQICKRRRLPRATMLRKAATYLAPEQVCRIKGGMDR